jgi:hypothetical protein
MSRAAFCALFAFAALPLPAHAAGQSAVGDWSGALHRGDAAYRVKFHVQATPDGRLTGTVSGLPGDDYTPIPAAVEASGNSLEITAAGGRYSGVWDQAQGAWVGSWKQAGLSEPVALRWNTDDSAPRMRLTKPIVIPVPTSPGVPSLGGGALIVPPSAR